jgi:hypothetical protein
MSDDFRSRLATGFSNLRKRGYFAQQNFWCCQSCGCRAVPDENADQYAFYHDQDEDGLRQAEKLNNVDRIGVYLAWSGNPKVIRSAFELAGLRIEHDRSENTRIWVTKNRMN